MDLAWADGTASHDLGTAVAVGMIEQTRIIILTAADEANQAS